VIPTTRQASATTTRPDARRWSTVLGAGVGTVALAMTSTDVADRMPGSYASASTGAHALLLTAGATLVVVGVAAWFTAPHELVGRVVLGVGVAWLAQELVGWTVAPVPTIGMLVAPWSVPLLVHLTFRFPDSEVRGRTARTLVGATYAATAVVSIAAVTIHDSFYDIDCWRTCASPPFVISNRPRTWDAIETGWLCLVAIVGLLSATRAGAGVVRRWRWPPVRSAAVLVPLALALCLEAVYAASRLMMVEDPAHEWFASLFELRALTSTALAAGTIAWLVQLAVRRRRLARLADELAQAAPGQLGPVLARTLGDDSVEVAYWSPTLGRYVDAEGRTSHAVGSDRIAVSVERAGQHLGVVTHEASRMHPDIAVQTGPAARLAFDNERLRAEQLAQIAELRRSRSQIVRTADDTRQRIERDLHDGAQQRLLAMSFQLRLAAASAASSGDDDTQQALDLAAREARACIDELRSLAHGIFPSVLTTAGLTGALDALRDDAAVPVHLDVADEQLDAPAAMASYLAVVESFDAAATADVRRVRVEGRRQDNSYRLVVEWSDGRQPIDAFAHVADRIGAVGGELSVEGATMEVLLPCAPS
jgi:signal transduction histidine kinase